MDNQQNPQSPVSTQEFLNSLRTELSLKGYLTPTIKQFLESLNSQQTISSTLFEDQKISEQLISFSVDEDQILQNLYMMGYLFYSFLPNISLATNIGKNVYAYLDKCYSQPLNQNDYSINSRDAAWYVLAKIVVYIEEELQTKIKQLAQQTQNNSQEDEFLKSKLKEWFI